MSPSPAVCRYLAPMRGFGRDVWLVLASQAVTVLSGGAWGVLANLYLLRLGYGPEFIGVVNFVLMLSMGASSLPGGMLGRRIGTRRAVAWSAVASAVLYCAFVAAWLVPQPLRSAWLVATGTLAGISFGITAVNYTPMLADLSPEESRSSVFSLTFALGTGAGLAGALAGGLLPGPIAAALGSLPSDAAAYGVSLLFAMATLLASAVLIWLVREPSGVEAEDPGSRTSIAPAGAESQRPPTRALISAGAVMFCSWLGLGTVVTFWNVYLDQAMHLATPAIGTVAAVTQAVAIPVSLAAPLLMARLSPRRTYPLALLGVAASIALVGLATGPLGASLAVVARFAFFSISSPTFATVSQSIVSPRWRGAMAGVVNTAYAAGFSVVALAGGYVAGAVGFRPLFVGGATMVMAAALLYWVLMGRPAAIRAFTTS